MIIIKKPKIDKMWEVTHIDKNVIFNIFKHNDCIKITLNQYKYNHIDCTNFNIYIRDESFINKTYFSDEFIFKCLINSNVPWNYIFNMFNLIEMNGIITGEINFKNKIKDLLT